MYLLTVNYYSSAQLVTIPVTENEGPFVQQAASEGSKPRLWTLSSQKTKDLLLIPPSRPVCKEK